MPGNHTNMFDQHRSPWDLEVRGVEIKRVVSAFTSMMREDDFPVWVQKVAPGTRRWFIEGFMSRAYIDTAAGDNDPETPVALPLMFLVMAGELAGAYGTATVYLREVGTEHALTARAGGEYAFMDETFDESIPAPFHPLLYDKLSSDKRFEKVKLRADVLSRITSGYMTGLGSVEEMDGPPAFLTLSASRGNLRWTSDWSRWGKPLVSGSSAASTENGHFELTVFPISVIKFLSGIHSEDEVTLGADCSSAASVFGVQGLDWAVWSPVRDENMERWGRVIRDSFGQLDFEVFDHEDKWDPRDQWSVPPSSLSFTNGDDLLFANIIDGVAGPDCIRISHMLGSGFIVNETLLREVTRVNENLVNARITVTEDGFIELITDVDNPSGVEHIVDGVKAMVAAIRSIDGFEEFLPLFAANAEDPTDIPND